MLRSVTCLSHRAVTLSVWCVLQFASQLNELRCTFMLCCYSLHFCDGICSLASLACSGSFIWGDLCHLSRHICRAVLFFAAKTPVLVALVSLSCKLALSFFNNVDTVPASWQLSVICFACFSSVAPKVKYCVTTCRVFTWCDVSRSYPNMPIANCYLVS